MAAACGSLGLCFYSLGDYVRACKLHEQARAIFEAIGDSAGVARTCNGLGNCYDSTGDYARAREMHEQHKVISEGLGDRAAVAKAYGNLASSHARMGDYDRACELHWKDLVICDGLGDRYGVMEACGNLGTCCLSMGDYARAVSYFTRQYDMAKDLQGTSHQGNAALKMGMALTLEVRANVRGSAAGAFELPAPFASTSACNDDAAHEAEKWLRTALDFGYKEAHLHLARLAFDVGSEDTALAHLQHYLRWYVEQCRNRCAGCYQTRGDDVRRTPEDGFKKRRIGWQLVGGYAQGYVRCALQVEAASGQARRVAGRAARGPPAFFGAVILHARFRKCTAHMSRCL